MNDGGKRGAPDGAGFSERWSGVNPAAELVEAAASWRTLPH
jgi:hypothetical protein